MLSSRFSLLLLVFLIVLWLSFQGVLFQPMKAYRFLTRKKIFPAVSNACVCRQVDQSPSFQWGIRHPNVHIYVLITGGLGNTLMAFSCALEAARSLGIKPPVLLVEKGGDFDFHHIHPSKFTDLSIRSIGELLPCTHVLTSTSFIQTLSGLSDRKEWLATTMSNFPLANSVIQITNYNECMGIHDDTFQVVRSCINKDIETYIEQHYGSRESFQGTLAIHIRMGQDTDDFIPPSPSREDIDKLIQETLPARIMVFTDNIPKARAVIGDMDVQWVSDTSYVECLLMGMCGSAIISHSTFSIMGCRLYSSKDVTITLPKGEGSRTYGLKLLDPSWRIIYK
jgi:hypothetical protein